MIAGAAGVAPAGDWFPPLIEALIAVSILYMAVENVLSVWLGSDSAASLRWRWLVAGAFGLVHGFGFSFVLQEDLQLAGSHLLLSLLAFNFGVELGSSRSCCWWCRPSPYCCSVRGSVLPASSSCRR